MDLSGLVAVLLLVVVVPLAVVFFRVRPVPYREGANALIWLYLTIEIAALAWIVSAVLITHASR